MLRRLFGALYVDMRCFGVSWLFSKHKIPHPNNGEVWKTTKNTSITECFALIPQYFFLWENFICWDVILGLYMLIWGASVFLGSFLSMKSPTQTNGEVWKTTKNTSITECFAATSTFTQYRFGKFFNAQLWENVHNVINSTERSDILVLNWYLCHISFLLTCYVCSTKIGETSDISKYFENFVFQTHGVLTRIYAAELRKQKWDLWFLVEHFIL